MSADRATVERLPRDLAEAEFAATFVEAAHLLGWVLASFRPARTAHGWRTAVGADGEGWPDYFCVHPASGDCFAAELKTRYRKAEPRQTQWGVWLEAAGIEHHFWWPPDWPDIVDRLARPAPRRR